MDTFILIVGFHHERGNEIEWSYPCPNPIKDVDRLTTFEFLSMPDQIHNQERDYCYFVFEDYFCTSCYQQVASSKIKEKSSEITRGTIQKAVCLFTKNFDQTPFETSYTRAKLQEATNSWFQQAYDGSFTNRTFIENFFGQLDKLRSSIASRGERIPESPFLKGSPVLKLFSRFGKNALLLLKLMLLEKKVVVYGVPIGETSDIILALESLLPLHNSKRHFLAPVNEGPSALVNKTSSPLIPSLSSTTTASAASNPVLYSASQAEFSLLQLPLRLSSYSFISPCVVLHQSDWLNSLPSYFVMSSNGLMSQRGQVLDMDATFDATTNSFFAYDSSLNQALSLSNEDRAFIDYIIQRISSGDSDSTADQALDTPSSNPIPPGSPATISKQPKNDPFDDFLLLESQEDISPHATVATGGHSSSNSGASHSSPLPLSPKSVTQVSMTNTWQTKEEWVRMMFVQYIKALLVAATNPQGQTRLDSFGGHWILGWTATNNYKAWQSSIDVRAVRADVIHSNLHHPGSDVNHGPSTLVGKGIQSVKGSIHTISTSTTQLVSTIGSWYTQQKNQSTNPWGLDNSDESQPQSTVEIISSTSAISTSTSPSSSTSTPPNTQNHSSRNAPSPPSPAASNSPSRLSSFIGSVRQTFSGVVRSSPIEPAAFDSLTSPTVTQPAQPSQASSNHLDDQDDLLGF